MSKRNPTQICTVEGFKPQHKSKGFFSVDLGAFRCAAVGGLNSAVAHLIMARGTGHDNRTTQWSVHAIDRRTGISRPNASKAMADLLQRGVWKRLRDGKHPIYEAVPGYQVPGGPFVPDEQEALAAIRNDCVMSDEIIIIAEMLVARGLARELQRGKSGRAFELDEVAIRARRHRYDDRP